MDGENRALITDELVELEKWPGAIQNVWNIADYFIGNVENILQTLKN